MGTMRAMSDSAIETATAPIERVDGDGKRPARSVVATAARGKRDAESRQLRENILNVATEEFGARGYKGTNLRHVANRLGVTRQALYHYFPHKHEILVVLFTNYFDELEANMAKAIEGVPAGQQFRVMLRAHIELMAGRPWISRVFEREDGEIPSSAATSVRKRRRALHALLVDTYEVGVRSGSLRPTDAKLIVSVLLGIAGWLHRWYKIDGRMKPAEIAAYAEDMIFSGIRADGPGSPQRG